MVAEAEDKAEDDSAAEHASWLDSMAGSRSFSIRSVVEEQSKQCNVDGHSHKVACSCYGERVAGQSSGLIRQLSTARGLEETHKKAQQAQIALGQDVGLVGRVWSACCSACYGGWSMAGGHSPNVSVVWVVWCCAPGSSGKTLIHTQQVWNAL